MPSLFTFRVNNQNFFSCKLESSRCTDQTKQHQRCKRTVVIGTPFCHAHLLYRRHLRIKATTLRNLPPDAKGLFAIDPMLPINNNAALFHGGDIITEYVGQNMSKEQLTRRYADLTAPYGAELIGGRIQDLACLRGVGALPNHQNKHLCKVEFKNGWRHDANNQRIYHLTIKVKPGKTIRNGEEIFIHYGDDYNFHEPGVSHTTRYISRARANNLPDEDFHGRHP
jgi:hypothetical protein